MRASSRFPAAISTSAHPRTRKRSLRPAAFFLVGSLVAAACGGDKFDGTNDPESVEAQENGGADDGASAAAGNGAERSQGGAAEEGAGGADGEGSAGEASGSSTGTGSTDPEDSSGGKGSGAGAGGRASGSSGSAGGGAGGKSAGTAGQGGSTGGRASGGSAGSSGGSGGKATGSAGASGAGGAGGGSGGTPSAAGSAGTAGASTCANENTYYPDDDEDGYGRSSGSVQSCSPPTSGSFVTRAGDCNDENANVYPDQRQYFSEPYRTAAGQSSFDYDCADGETLDADQKEAPNCGLLSVLRCSGSGYLPADRPSGENELCGSKRFATCRANLLLCRSVESNASEGARCR